MMETTARMATATLSRSSNNETTTTNNNNKGGREGREKQDPYHLDIYPTDLSLIIYVIQ